MDRIGRIAAMEEKFCSALAAVHALDYALEEYSAVQEDIRILETYLSSKEWREDLKADEKGLIPSSLARGVLSEDGIYTLLEENDDIRQRLSHFPER